MAVPLCACSVAAAIGGLLVLAAWSSASRLAQRAGRGAVLGPGAAGADPRLFTRASPRLGDARSQMSRS
jgi:hypothetical protein